MQPRSRKDLNTNNKFQEIVPDERETDVALNEVLELGNRLVIIGGPGSGKTTVLLHMAWALSTSLLSGQTDPAGKRLGLKIEPNRLPLPIFVPLASFARYRRNLSGNAPARDRTLAHFISYHLISKEADFDLPSDFFVQLIKDGRDVLLLLDGLDEVANENERAEVRQSVEDLVSGRENLRIVVTCRTIAYRSGRTALGANFREITVLSLDAEQHITPMVQQAYTCIYPKDAERREDRVQDLLSGIHRLEAERRARLGEDAESLVDSPLMVRLLLIVHFNNRTLPDERAELFDKAINALLQVDYGQEESVNRELSRDWKLFRDMAQHLAFHMHQQGRDQGREIEEPALKLALRQEAEFEPRVDDFLSQARQRGSVLEERGGAYRFIHLAFQELLAARYLREVRGAEGREAILTVLADRLENPWWREPILLLTGYMGANAAKSARDFLAALARAGSQPNAQLSAAELAASAVLEWRESGEAIQVDCAQRIWDLLVDEDVLAQSQPVLRARTGDRLSQLGDPRFDPQCYYLPNDDMLGFVQIAADVDFWIGIPKHDVKRVAELSGGHVYDDEVNDTVTPTQAFYIARYPVTVAQFRTFVDATQFALGNPDALRDPDNRPVRYVSWHEALAYCDWLNHMLVTAPALGQSRAARLVREGDWRITLPSELEWEKAARGGLKDRIYPWGDSPEPNQANYTDSEINDTSSVGCFPANGYGLYDMSGNVWEWTRSLFGTDSEKPEFTYPYDLNDRKREELTAGDDMRRVVRGGSWGNPSDVARCAVRDGYQPDDRYFNLGFRVVLRSAPVSSYL